MLSWKMNIVVAKGAAADFPGAAAELSGATTEAEGESAKRHSIRQRFSPYIYSC